MIIKLLNTNEEKTVVDKTYTEIESVSGYVKQSTSEQNVSVQMQVRDRNFNYAYIPEFNRYYFVSDTTIVRSDLMEISLICDVLMSFKSQILNCKAIVSRNENRYNAYINDNQVLQYQDTKEYIRRFPRGFTNQSYVLAVAGGDN